MEWNRESCSPLFLFSFPNIRAHSNPFPFFFNWEFWGLKWASVGGKGMLSHVSSTPYIAIVCSSFLISKDVYEFISVLFQVDSTTT